MRMYSVDYVVARCLSACLSVRLSHAGIVSKRLNILLYYHTFSEIYAMSCFISEMIQDRAIVTMERQGMRFIERCHFK